MSSFYQGMLQKGLTPAAALRAAQLEMWKQEKWNLPIIGRLLRFRANGDKF